jgi:hypothetical protein
MKLISLTVFILSLVTSTFSHEAQKIDELHDSSCNDLTLRVGSLIDELVKLKDSKGYVVVCNGKLTYVAKNKLLDPRLNEAKAEIDNIKNANKILQL